MDYEYWIRIAKQYRIAYLSTYLANSRLHRETKTLSKQVEVHTEIVQMLQQQYGHVSPRWLYGLACVALTSKLMPNLQGLYHDGWASPYIRIFPPDTAHYESTLILQGTVPAQLLPLTLCLTLGNQPLHQAIIETSDFTLQTDWHPSGTSFSNSLPTELQITADKSICPQTAGLHQDQRMLSFRIKNLSLRSGKGPKEVIYSVWLSYLLLGVLPLLFLWKCLTINRTLPHAELGRKSRQLWHAIKSRAL